MAARGVVMVGLLLLALVAGLADGKRQTITRPDGGLPVHHGARRLLEQLTDKQVLALFDKWNAALQTLDPKKVAALYAPNGVLLPTVSNLPRNTPALIEDYFEHFLILKPVGLINKYFIDRPSDNVVINQGLYTFNVTRQPGNYHDQVKARFTFVYEKQPDGQWLISEHHSSAMPEVALPKESDIEALFPIWNAALATLDANKVAALYSKDAVLVPTVSNIVRSTHAGIVDYFEHFLLNKPQGTIDESHVLIWSPTLASRAGIYTFTLHREGRVDTVKARYTFVYQKVNGQWLIAEHHSSGLPEPKLPSSRQVHGLFAAWNDALYRHDTERILSYYTPDAILLPTLSGEVKDTPEKKRAYFVEFMNKNPVGHITEEHIQVLDGKVAINDGLYTFKTTVDGKTGAVHARYTFVYVRVGNQWKIKAHHSSKVPATTRKLIVAVLP